MTDRYEFMDIQTLLAIEGIEAERDIPYLPLPNTVDVILSEILAPENVTPTAFTFAFFDDGDVLLAHNRRREVEVPGGHRDPVMTNDPVSVPSGVLEHPAVAAVRECFEETGAKVTDVVAVGFMRSETEGPRPEGYRYPYPVSCQQFFTGMISSVEPFKETDECRPPVRLTQEEAENRLNGRTLALYRAARETLFPVLEPTAAPAP